MNGDWEAKIDRICERVDSIHEAQGAHGELLARLDERTLAQDKRLDGVEETAKSASRRAGGSVGAGTGVAGGGLMVLLLRLFGIDLNGG